jgi:hypothetical protein
MKKKFGAPSGDEKAEADEGEDGGTTKKKKATPKKAAAEKATPKKRKLDETEDDVEGTPVKDEDAAEVKASFHRLKDFLLTLYRSLNYMPAPREVGESAGGLQCSTYESRSMLMLFDQQDWQLRRREGGDQEWE